MFVQILVKHAVGNDYPKIFVIGRNLTPSQRSTLLTDATVTLTVNGTDVVGTVTSASAGKVSFALPTEVYNLAAGSYALTMRSVDAGGFTRTFAKGTWLQEADA